MEQKKSKTKVVYIILLVFFCVCAVTAGVVLAVRLWPDKPDFDEYKKDVSSAVSSSEEVLADNPIDFAALTAKNPDIFGYIQVDGTVIDYPLVMASSEQKDDFYLNHSWEKQPFRAGAVYAEKINAKDFSDPVTVLYGHNMLNGSMFGTLKRFRNTDFFNQNRNIHIYIPGHILTYEIASAFAFDDRHLMYSYNFRNIDDMTSFLNECLNPHSLTRNVISENLPSAKDKFVVLSTCTGNETERYLIVGYLKEDIKTKQ